jgi:hypothetical protein
MSNSTNSPLSVQSADSSPTLSLDNPDVPASSDVIPPSHTPARHSHPPPPTHECIQLRAREAAHAISENFRSFAFRDGFAKLSLMYQTAREAADAVSDDTRSSACQNAFEKAMSVSLKDLVLPTEAALTQRRVEKFHQLCNFRVLLGVRVNSLPDIQCGSGRSSRPLAIHFRPVGPPSARPPPIITVDHFRPTTFQLPHSTSEERHRMAQNIAPDLMDQSPPPIYRGTTDRSNSRSQDRSFMNRIAISASVLCEKGRFQKKMARRAPVTVVGDGRSGNHEQSTR